MQSLLDLPTDPRALVVFAHGAGAPMTHASMAAISQALVDRHIGVFRFNFPFMEAGKRRVDSRAVATGAIVEAVNAAAADQAGLPLFLGGHSFGGRMASHAVLASDLGHDLDVIRGLVFTSFPLHPAKKPATTRAEHLAEIDLPMLFVSGTRDSLAEPELLTGVVDGLGGRAQLRWLDTADHGYKVLKRSRTSQVPVFDELADYVAAFIGQHLDC
jgi:predicted alpha/beta-hydrolase family hydrolase